MNIQPLPDPIQTIKTDTTIIQTDDNNIYNIAVIIQTVNKSDLQSQLKDVQTSLAALTLSDADLLAWAKINYPILDPNYLSLIQQQKQIEDTLAQLP